MYGLVGAAGFEPTLAESESDVLPLNYAPKTRPIIMYNDVFANIFFCTPHQQQNLCLYDDFVIPYIT